MPEEQFKALFQVDAVHPAAVAARVLCRHVPEHFCRK
jgi:hypothetical protein